MVAAKLRDLGFDVTQDDAEASLAGTQETSLAGYPGAGMNLCSYPPILTE